MRLFLRSAVHLLGDGIPLPARQEKSWLNGKGVAGGRDNLAHPLSDRSADVCMFCNNCVDLYQMSGSLPILSIVK